MKAQVSFTTDLDRKRKAEQIARDLGMSLSTVLNMCLAQMNYQRGLPFSTKLPNPERVRQQKERAIIQLTHQRPREIVKTDGHGKVLNPKECRDFIDWMING